MRVIRVLDYSGIGAGLPVPDYRTAGSPGYQPTQKPIKCSQFGRLAHSIYNSVCGYRRGAQVAGGLKDTAEEETEAEKNPLTAQKQSPLLKIV